MTIKFENGMEDGAVFLGEPDWFLADESMTKVGELMKRFARRDKSLDEEEDFDSIVHRHKAFSRISRKEAELIKSGKVECFVCGKRHKGTLVC